MEIYTVPEKTSILQAYTKGDGVAGLAEIIGDKDDEEEQKAADVKKEPTKDDIEQADAEEVSAKDSVAKLD